MSSPKLFVSTPNIDLDQWVQMRLQFSPLQLGPQVGRSVTTRVQGSEKEHMELPNTPENLASNHPNCVVRRQTSREIGSRPLESFYTYSSPQYIRTPAAHRQRTTDKLQIQRSPQRIYGRDSVSPYACMSCLRNTFIRRIRFYRKTRRLACDGTIENAFTGEEAVAALFKVFADRVSKQDCTTLVNLLWHNPAPVFLPTLLSPRSVQANSVFETSDEIFTLIDNDDMPDPQKSAQIQGVITGLTACYVPTCSPKYQGGCYAQSCPNRQGDRRMVYQPLVLDDNSPKDPEDYKDHKSWAKNVPEELLKSLPKSEIARQENMYELIYTERNHLNLLKAIDQMVIPELLATKLLPPEENQKLMDIMFPNYKWFLEKSDAMYDEITRRVDGYEEKCLPRIDDIFLKYYLDFEEPVRKYSKSIPWMTLTIKKYSEKYPEFGKFINDLGYSPAFNRLGFLHVLLQPVRRSVTLGLILKTLASNTPNDNPTYNDLLQCIAVVTYTTSVSDEEIAASSDIITLQLLEKGLGPRAKNLFYTPLRLLDPSRKVLFHGSVKVKNINDTDIKMFVLDNFLLFTKSKTSNGEEEYKILKRPIPIVLVNCRELPVTSLSSSLRNGSSNSLQTNEYILEISSIGQREDPVQISFKTTEEVSKWVSTINIAKAAAGERWEDMDICRLDSIDDHSFTIGAAVPMGGQGTVRSTAPFVNVHGQKCVAIGTDTDVYFLNREDNSLRRSFPTRNITQLTVMAKYRVLLVLADKVLTAYPLDALSDRLNPRPPERLANEIDKHVHFMRIGQYNGLDYLIYKKRRGNNSDFYTLRPKTNIKSIMMHPPKRNFIGSSTSWFDSDKGFCVGTDCFDIQFVGDRLFVACEQGFETINLSNLGRPNNLIKDIDWPLSVFCKYLLDSKPLTTFKVKREKVLVCYNKLVFYINNTRNVLLQDETSPVLFEWENLVDNVVYRYPFIAGFSANMIEIHHVETGELVDVLFGEDIRVTHDYCNEVQGCKVDPRLNVQLIFSFALQQFEDSV
ncbi:CNH domain-containing protein [Phycomyces nitens]|nr:CNH domain-containing protein [Phycomyces nitens]